MFSLYKDVQYTAQKFKFLRSMIDNVMEERVLSQKMELERVYSQPFVEREGTERIRSFLDKSLIKAVTGPRRAGKTFFSFQILRGRRFGYVNFDDEFLARTGDLNQVVKLAHRVYGDFDFLFFDEVQNVEGWELFLNRLQRQGYNLIITGSNSKLLGSELASHLTGRYVETTILPFSFREFLKAKGFEVEKEYLALKDYQGRVMNLLSEYLDAGGFPEVVVKNLDFKPYVESLFNAVVLKDVVGRYKIRFASSMYELARYLVSNFSSLVSFRRLNNMLGFRSIHTVINYTRYLEETFLVFSLNNFSLKVSEQIRSPRKVYVIDNSIISTLSFRFIESKGKLMENLVAVELLRKKLQEGFEIFYLKINNNEVDFVLKEDFQVKQLIQVTYASSRNDIEKREVRALLKASEQLKCKNLLIITWDYEDEFEIDNKTIRCIPLWKWLLKL